MKSAVPQRLRHALAHMLNRGSDIRFGLKPGYSEAVSEQRGRNDHGSGDPLRDALYEDSFERFLTTLLRYGDRNSMAHSREVRLPFCDHRLSEFILSLPPELIMGDVQTKRPIREGLREFLPEAIAARWNKQGFRPPQDLWFTSPAFLELMQSRGQLEPDEDVLEDGIAFAGVSKYPARVKCALLGWMAWKDATAQAAARTEESA